MAKYLDKEGVKELWDTTKGIVDSKIEEELYEGPDTNGYDFVDMGEAGIWATCNVGANSPEEAGLYFAWGETEGYPNASGDKRFTWDYYKYGTGSNLTKYNSTDGLTTLELVDDAAHVNMSGDWRMPTEEEFLKLYEVCDAKWLANYKDIGAVGLLFTLKTDSSKELFFPAAGYLYDTVKRSDKLDGRCWLSSLYTPNRNEACCIGISNYNKDNKRGSIERYYGQNIRGFISSTTKSPKYLTKQQADETYAKKDEIAESPFVKGEGDGSAVMPSRSNSASGQNSFAHGMSSTVTGMGGYAGGLGTKSYGQGSHAEGVSTTAGEKDNSNMTAHAEGSSTKAIANGAHSEGQSTTASGIASHSEGEVTNAIGYTSHSEGQGTQAIGNFSHAEGYGSQARGNSSHAEGSASNASGFASHSEGNNTIANNNSEHASGNYNNSTTGTPTEGSEEPITGWTGSKEQTLFSVGNGQNPATRHNAFEIKQSGDILIPDVNAEGQYYQKPMINLQEELTKASANANWEAEENEVGYIENRPIVKRIKEEVLFDGSLNLNYSVPSLDGFYRNTISNINLILGDKYTIVVNGVRYENLLCKINKLSSPYISDTGNDARINNTSCDIYFESSSTFISACFTSSKYKVNSVINSLQLIHLVEYNEIDPKYLPIVQEVGTAEDKIMSQNAVYNELHSVANSLGSSIGSAQQSFSNQLNTAASGLSEKIDTVNNKLSQSKQDKITAGTGLSFEGNTLNCTLDTTVFKVVESLPTTPATNDENKIHLVLATSGEDGNLYEEYLYVEGKWELLGQSKVEVDLSNYVRFNDTVTGTKNGVITPEQMRVITYLNGLTSVYSIEVNHNVGDVLNNTDENQVVLKIGKREISQGTPYTTNKDRAYYVPIASATTEQAGVMTAADKKKLDSINPDEYIKKSEINKYISDYLDSVGFKLNNETLIINGNDK